MAANTRRPLKEYAAFRANIELPHGETCPAETANAICPSVNYLFAIAKPALPVTPWRKNPTSRMDQETDRT